MKRRATKSACFINGGINIFFPRKNPSTKSPGMARRGAFIVLEGLDRSGKSTQVCGRGCPALGCWRVYGEAGLVLPTLEETGLLRAPSRARRSRVLAAAIARLTSCICGGHAAGHAPGRVPQRQGGQRSKHQLPEPHDCGRLLDQLLLAKRPGARYAAPLAAVGVRDANDLCPHERGQARCCSPCALTSAIPEREMAGCYRHRALWSEDALRSLAVRP